MTRIERVDRFQDEAEAVALQVLRRDGEIRHRDIRKLVLTTGFDRHIGGASGKRFSNMEEAVLVERPAPAGRNRRLLRYAEPKLVAGRHHRTDSA